MKHVHRITVAAAQEKQEDPVGIIFLWIWMMVMSFILAGALGEKSGSSAR